MAIVVLPGDVIREIGPSEASTQILGLGVEKQGSSIVCNQPGILRQTDVSTYINVQSKRYVPQPHDLVLGIIVGRVAECFKVDVGASDPAILSFYAFAGATKRNRPNLKTGDLIYAKVLKASRHLEPELVCVDQDLKSQGMGPLPAGGFHFRTSLNLARRLRAPNSAVLKQISTRARIGYDICMCAIILFVQMAKKYSGVNGHVWLKAANPRHVIWLANFLQDVEFVPDHKLPAFVDEQLSKLNQKT